jgi:cytochrome bd-type quinol oxidase subunit 2
MVSFYNFYITWNTLVGLASAVSLGFLIKYDNTKQLAPDYCDGSISSYNFNLYNLMYFCLVVRILFTLIQTIIFCKTYQDQESTLRKVINFVMFIFYAICITGLILTAVKLHKNYTDCYQFYMNNDSYLIKSYIILCVVYIIESIGTFIVGLSYMCQTNSYKKGYERIYY